MATPGIVQTQAEKVDPLLLESTGLVQEVGSQAVWSLSSCKPGFGVQQLRDGSKETYWQSDGQLPHLLNIQFRKKTIVKDIYIYVDYKTDESYTPSKISVRAGTHFGDLQEIEVIDLTEPTGWIPIPLRNINDQPIKTYMIQIAVVGNHQSGRDTHIRQVRIHSVKKENIISVFEMERFSTREFQQYATLR
ncbi:anaphase-promoting complex subunit 10-like [Artemia franciscana]|uniref:Anaphase-promoting complex subunit 10 n=1 Tax=Artemia franciscana TaxID=6661 RepID=A0AA88L1K6_ARTSF|nr:hypothetical protein QYM36_010247 [Artemia franciscana]KAK2715603.1 hypothetical protein QYM36_010247 [Artemia franciscana]